MAPFRPLVLMLVLLAAPLAAATHHRTYVYCENPTGGDVHCGATYKEVDRNCIHRASLQSGENYYLCRGSQGEVGLGIDHDDGTPALCGSTPEDCYGVNAGYWDCGVHKCLAFVEVPQDTGDDARVYHRLGAPWELCVDVGGRNPICVPALT